jgi:hypothetical protein
VGVLSPSDVLFGILPVFLRIKSQEKNSSLLSRLNSASDCEVALGTKWGRELARRNRKG